jgi:hypothetical protein
MRRTAGLVLHLDVDDVGELDIGALARVVRAAEQGVLHKPVVLHADLGQRAAHGAVEIVFGVFEGELEFGKAKHGKPARMRPQWWPERPRHPCREASGASQKRAPAGQGRPVRHSIGFPP